MNIYLLQKCYFFENYTNGILQKIYLFKIIRLKNIFELSATKKYIQNYILSYFKSFKQH